MCGCAGALESIEPAPCCVPKSQGDAARQQTSTAREAAVRARPLAPEQAAAACQPRAPTTRPPTPYHPAASPPPTSM